MSDSDPAATFGYVAEQLDRLGIAYLHVVEPRIKGTELIVEGQAPVAAEDLRPRFGGPLIASRGCTRYSAKAILAGVNADHTGKTSCRERACQYEKMQGAAET